MRRLQIFFRLKWEEVGEPVIEHIKGYWFVYLAVTFLYCCGVRIGFWICPEDPIWAQYTAAGMCFGVLTAVCLLLIVLVFSGIWVFVKWLKSNWEEAGRILAKEREVKD
jgi:hypothetical protein